MVKSERWRKVVGCPGYEVSDWGRVRSHIPKPARVKLPEILSGYTRPGEAPVVCVAGRRRGVYLLVLEAFRGPAPRNHVARFRDGARANCRLENLEWAPRGGRRPRPRLTAEQRAHILKSAQGYFAYGPTCPGAVDAIARQLGLPARQVARVLRDVGGAG